jgi:prevent-host-death family protein
MPFVNIRELARDTSRVVSDVAASGRPAIITRGGKPVATLMPIDATELEDWILANDPALVKSYAEADKDLAAGRSISLDRYLAEQRKRDAATARRRSAAARSRRARRAKERQR